MVDLAELEGPGYEVRTNTDLVTHVHNVLGWRPPDDGQPWLKQRNIEAGKLKAKRAQKPRLYTIDNLLLATEYLRQRRQEVKSPAAVCFFVERALKAAADSKDVTPLDERVERALSAEHVRAEQGDADAPTWIRRLTRSQGDGRADVVAEWEAARG